MSQPANASYHDLSQPSRHAGCRQCGGPQAVRAGVWTCTSCGLPEVTAKVAATQGTAQAATVGQPAVMTEAPAAPISMDDAPRHQRRKGG